MSAYAYDSPSLEDIVSGEIRAEMARQRLTNVSLAKRMGKTKFWVGDRLKGTTRIEVGDLELFARTLGVPVERLVRRQGLEPRTQCYGDSPGQSDLHEPGSVTYLDQYRAGHGLVAALELVS